MSAINRFLAPVFQVLDEDGNPVVGAKLYFYDVGTTTLKTIYSDAALTTPAINPQVTDSRGIFAPIFLARDDYKVRLEKPDTTTIFEYDGVRYPYSTGILDRTTNDHVLELTDIKIFNKAGVDVLFEINTLRTAALAINASEYAPTLTLANGVLNGASPALVFRHQNGSALTREAAIASNDGVLAFYTSDPFGTEDREKQVVIDRQGIVRPARDDDQDLGRITERWQDIYATNGTINTCDSNYKGSIETALPDWETFQACAPITHTFNNTKTPDNPRRHYSWDARKCIAFITKKYGDLKNHAMFTLTPTPEHEFKDRAGVRDNEMTAWVHTHVNDLKNMVDQQQQAILALEAKIAVLETI